MKYAKLFKEIGVEVSEAKLADKEKAYTRAKACLMRVQVLIEKRLSEPE